MNGRIAKKLRKELKAEKAKWDATAVMEIKKLLNGMDFKDRFKIAWKIVRGRF